MWLIFQVPVLPLPRVLFQLVVLSYHIYFKQIEVYCGHFRKVILALGNRMNYRSCFSGAGKTVENLGGRNDDWV